MYCKVHSTVDQELEGWTSDFNLPSSVWLPGFFNPQSFLTAIMQVHLSTELLVLTTPPVEHGQEERVAAGQDVPHLRGIDPVTGVDRTELW